MASYENGRLMTVTFSCLLSLAGLGGSGAAFEGGLLPDWGFERTVAGGRPAWRPSAKFGYSLLPGKGIDGSAAVGLEDGGTNDCTWLSPPVYVQPSRLYGFAAHVKTSGSNGFTMGTFQSNETGGVPDTKGRWAERKAVIFSLDRPGGYPARSHGFLPHFHHSE